MKSKEHDFHLVNPSPWPISLSAAILVLVLGLVGTFHKQIPGIFGLISGISVVLVVLFYWWADVIKEAIYDQCHTAVVKHGLKIAMCLFILSEILFFITFFCSFFKSWLDPVFLFEAFSPKDRIKWPPSGILPLDPWSFPFMSTLVLLLSGTTITSAHHFLLESDKRGTIKMLFITILLGVFFMIVQAIEYSEVNFSLKRGREELIYASNFYMITGFHCVHVIIGIIFLSVCLFRAWKDQFTPQDHLCLEFASWYWHFVDIIWIFVFIFVYCLSIH
ncbi:cytochrome C oxidase subunit III [Wolbachia endosymbiont of Cruorifilaria tuberocauda]|uniref:cytochrome c oxidase subunit 3 n=1 Tax=Wolbachia endosymbiont of Cruorifilaria tuberocauda TaxID=1812111 RepID=UPI00158A7778|nr:cytochrome c oxidase subunit 3 [Wolbachia endosymbiont of Cruorifilaria tuberocauda]QKX01736.1 cytochrome C oxidase subunit III [Wolbachia endosymbiont of Cruorifilaria tuberocauda]